MFQIGELVRYGLSGVCEITAIGSLKMSGIDPNRDYYTMRNLFSDGIVYTPVDTKVPMRPLITVQEANDLIDSIPTLECPQLEARNSIELNAAYKEAFRFDQCGDLAVLLKLLYAKRAASSRGRRFNSTDERVFHQAQSLLFQELATVLQMPLNQVEKYIEERMATAEQA